MDKLTKMCLCKGIPRAIIKKAIKNGSKTLENVQKVTGADQAHARVIDALLKLMKF